MTRRAKDALGLALFLSAFFVVWSLRATVFYSIDESITSPILRALYSNLVKFCLWVLPAVAYARWIKRVPAAPYLGIMVAPALRQWCLFLIVISAFLLLTLIVETAKGAKTFSISRISTLFTVTGLLSLLISPLLEEILFRGLVMNEFLSLLPMFFANILSSLFFVDAHWPYWLSHGDSLASVSTKSVGIFAFSLLAGWLFARSRSIWPPTFAHIANNLLAALLVAKNG